MPTAAAVMLQTLAEAGISYLFANFGSDHPAILEALAEARAKGQKVPTVITCPNEMVALSAAHGHALVSGRAQAVLVHVDCGTQALGGAVHNAARARVPVLILAGASPFTQHGELPGSRNEFIHWIQDVFDQRGLVRGYMRYENEIRTGRNMGEMFRRALQFAESDPKGPVYLMIPREVLEEEVPTAAARSPSAPAIAPMALAPASVEILGQALRSARTPLIVTSYLGRSVEAVHELERMARRLGLGVLESVPHCVNFPADDPLYQGSQWNEQSQNEALAAADVMLVIDADVPWIPLVNQPRKEAKIYHIDIDPIKERMPLFGIGAEQLFRADAATALAQINAWLDLHPMDETIVAPRRTFWHTRHIARLAELERREQPRGDGITGEILTAALRRYVDAETIVLNEGITHNQIITDHLKLSRPGGLFANGGSSLGWHGGAAIGIKLAAPEKTVIALTGDGSYMFSQPATVHWMARQYGTPFLQVIYNNRGWKAPKLSTLAIHPDGYASRANTLAVEFDPPPDYAAIAAAAGGAFARKVTSLAALDDAIAAALHAVRVEKRAAVLDIWLPHL
jgi:acetolactate synthase-1/2/3 large subunit